MKCYCLLQEHCLCSSIFQLVSLFSDKHFYLIFQLKKRIELMHVHITYNIHLYLYMIKH
jgi:hypothetical protein